MNKEKEEKLLGYITYLSASTITNEYLGKQIRHVTQFLSGHELSQKGWKEYRAVMLSAQTTCLTGYFPAEDAIREFLAFCKVKGFNRKSRRKFKSLEKLSAISEKNKTLIAAFGNYLIDKNNLSKHTVKSYMFSINLYFRYSNEVSKSSIKCFITTLEEKRMKPATICMRINALNKFAEFLNKPELKMEQPKITRKLDLDNIPTEAEYERLLEYLKTKKTPDHYYRIRIIASTGARYSEFVQFTWEHIQSGHVDLRGKGNKYRRFFFPEPLIKEIRRYAAEHNKSGLIFLNRHGNPISSRGINEILKSFSTQTNIEKSKLHAHAFRHFFAKMFLKKNKDIIQLADLMGHENVDTTRIYLQKTFNEQQADYNKTVNW
jgi:site-specific recombinase XerD